MEKHYDMHPEEQNQLIGITHVYEAYSSRDTTPKNKVVKLWAQWDDFVSWGGITCEIMPHIQYTVNFVSF